MKAKYILTHRINCTLQLKSSGIIIFKNESFRRFTRLAASGIAIHNSLFLCLSRIRPREPRPRRLVRRTQSQLFALSNIQGSSVSIVATAWGATVRFPSDSSLIPIHTMPIESWVQQASFGVAIRTKSDGTWSWQLSSIQRHILQGVWCLTSCSFNGLMVRYCTWSFAFSIAYQVTYRMNDRHTNKLKTNFLM